MNHNQEKWTTLSQIKSLLERKWQKGHFLRGYMESSELFPMRIPLRKPNSDELSKQFPDAHEWVQQYKIIDKKQLFRIEWTQINHRIRGRNELPCAIVFECRADLIRFIGKCKDFDLFTLLSKELLDVFPKLKSWIIKSPLSVLEFASAWEKLIRVTEWMVNTPVPQIYLRQLSLCDIDTKFIEKHKALLSEWFDILLNPTNINLFYTGIKGFERRYGFLDKPVQVRFRILDESKFIHGLSDLTVRADEFCALKLDYIDSVFVTENFTNVLAFPMVKNSIILFGNGYGFDYLQNANWLNQKNIWYWGDIDTHGFVILSQFRKLFPTTKSFLMDRETLLFHKQYWAKEESPSEAKPDNFNKEEHVLYDDLRNNKLGKTVRLEQEFIIFDYLKSRLVEIGNNSLGIQFD